MKAMMRLSFSILILALITGCASTEVVQRRSEIGSKKIAKPDRIYVYPFASTPEDLPAWSVKKGWIE